MTRSELSVVALAMTFVALSASPGEAARNLQIQVGRPGGMVISGANVCLGLEASSSGEGFAITDAMGIARFDNVPTGTRVYVASVTAPGVAGATKTFRLENNIDGEDDPPQIVMVSLPGNGAECQAPADPPPPPPPSTPLRPTPSVGVDILVQTYDGVPLSGVAVCAGLGPGPDSALFGRETTDASGRARIEGLPAGGTGGSQIVLTASKVCAVGQAPRGNVNGVPVYDCGVGATWINPRVALPSPVTFQVGAADQVSADQTGEAADFNCALRPPNRYPTSWRVHPANPQVALNATQSPSVRFDQHLGAEVFYDFVWTVSNPSVLELVEANPNDKSATVRGLQIGTSTITAQLLTQLDARPQTSATGGTATVTVGQAQPGPTPTPVPGGAAAAFLEVADVFHHPRCVNCHVQGDTPKQRDSRDLHREDGRRMRPRRGEDCTRCHSSSPTTTGYDAPVAPVFGTAQAWSMPPASMAFEDSSRMGGLRLPGDICRMIKQNAGSPEAVVEHLTNDDLVRWALDPDNDLAPAHPQGSSSFLQKMQQWAQQGGDCPP